MEQVAQEWVAQQGQEQVQYIMNSGGELETWDTKNSEDKNLTELNNTVDKIKKQLEEKQDEM
jgi:hypothetical protein